MTPSVSDDVWRMVRDLEGVTGRVTFTEVRFGRGRGSDSR